eukprot:6181506-Pleurochrysis_carterae.AAC.1
MQRALICTWRASRVVVVVTSLSGDSEDELDSALQSVDASVSFRGKLSGARRGDQICREGLLSKQANSLNREILDSICGFSSIT